MIRRRNTIRSSGDVLELLDRSNTNPICPDCGYRTIAIDRLRCACEHCGQIIGDEQRAVRHLISVFGGAVIVERKETHHAVR